MNIYSWKKSENVLNWMEEGGLCVSEMVFVDEKSDGSRGEKVPERTVPWTVSINNNDHDVVSATALKTEISSISRDKDPRTTAGFFPSNSPSGEVMALLPRLLSWSKTRPQQWPQTLPRTQRRTTCQVRIRETRAGDSLCWRAGPDRGDMKMQTRMPPQAGSWSQAADARWPGRRWPREHGTPPTAGWKERSVGQVRALTDRSESWHQEMSAWNTPRAGEQWAMSV